MGRIYVALLGRQAGRQPDLEEVKARLARLTTLLGCAKLTRRHWQDVPTSKRSQPDSPSVEDLGSVSTTDTHLEEVPDFAILGRNRCQNENMSSTYISLYSHIVFATRDRAPMIGEDWRQDLHNYMGGTIKGLSAKPIIIGGVADHVHLLVGMTAQKTSRISFEKLRRPRTSGLQSDTICLAGKAAMLPSASAIANFR